VYIWAKLHLFILLLYGIKIESTFLRILIFSFVDFNLDDEEGININTLLRFTLRHRINLMKLKTDGHRHY